MTFQQRLAMAKAKRESEREAKEREFLYRHKVAGEAFAMTLKFRCSMCKTVSLYEVGKTDDGICMSCKPDSAAMALVEVLYEQALRQAEFRVEIEQALERFDMDEYYKLVEKYREAEQVGTRIGN